MYLKKQLQWLHGKNKHWDGVKKELAKEIGGCQVMKKLRPFPTGKMGQWDLCKGISGQTDYSGSDVEDELKEDKAGRKKAG